MSQKICLNFYINWNCFDMYAFKIACWALIYIFRLRFPPGVSISTHERYLYPGLVKVSDNSNLPANIFHASFMSNIAICYQVLQVVTDSSNSF